jgi:hypothetical protein
LNIFQWRLFDALHRGYFHSYFPLGFFSAFCAGISDAKRVLRTGTVSRTPGECAVLGAFAM